MSQVFNGQSLLQLKLDTGITISGATSKKILWQDPVGGSGEWVVTEIDGSSLVYDVQAGDITVPGDWKLQSRVEIGGKVGFGAIVKQNFKAVLNS